MFTSKTLAGMVLLGALTVAAPYSLAQVGPGGVGMQDRDRPLPREENRVGTAAQLPPMPPDDEEIYGASLMSPKERADYTIHVKQMSSEQKRVETRVAHERQMQQRAKERGVTLGKAPSRREVAAQERTRQEERAQVYGYSLMTQQEVNRYFERLRSARTERQRRQIRAEHRKQMEARARERGVKLPAG